MKIITLTEKNFESALTEAAGVIRRGGIIVYPTDTAYGLGVDATNREAVQKLYKLKKRDTVQATHVVVSGIEMARRYITYVDLGEKYWPGPLTIIDTAIRELPRELLGADGSIGVRVPDNRFAQNLAAVLDGPITTPSANYKGDPTPYTLDQIIENFGDANPYIDLVIDAGELPGGVSTLVSVMDNTTKVIRAGKITRADLSF